LILSYDNSSLGNKTFTKKKGSPGELNCYASSKLFVEHQIASFDDWTENSVLRRRKEIEEWATRRWQVSMPPKVEVIDEPMENILARADNNGVGDEMRALLEAVKDMPISPSARTNCISFRPDFNWQRSVFAVYPEDGFFWFKVRAWNMARYEGAVEEEAIQLFGQEVWQRKQKADVYEFIDNLNSFFRKLE